MKKALLGFIFSIFAIQIHADPALHSISQDLILEPNHTETITNYFPWAISGKCKLESDDEVITLEVSVKGDGSINGKTIKENHKEQIMIHNNEMVLLTASGGAILKITKIDTPNQGIPQHNATAHCSM